MTTFVDMNGGLGSVAGGTLPRSLHGGAAFAAETAEEGAAREAREPFRPKLGHIAPRAEGWAPSRSNTQTPVLAGDGDKQPPEVRKQQKPPPPKLISLDFGRYMRSPRARKRSGFLATIPRQGEA